jgi:hypothetical protein
MYTFFLFKVRIAKRHRKQVYFDNARHNTEVLLNAKKKDEAKISKVKYKYLIYSSIMDTTFCAHEATIYKLFVCLYLTCMCWTSVGRQGNTFKMCYNLE